MTDNQLEQKLRDLSERMLPDAWREPILEEARREAKPLNSSPQAWLAVILCARHVFMRSPVTASTLAALWVLICVFKSSTPSDTTTSLFLAKVNLRHPLGFISRSVEIQLVEEWKDELPPASRP